MASETLYAGPAKVYRGTTAFFPESENGEVKFDIEQERVPVASGMHGLLRYQQKDVTGKITLKPFDNWGILPQIFPASVGASQGLTAGALVIGTKGMGLGTVVPCKIWVPGDGRLYTAACSMVYKPPQMHLGATKALFDTMVIMTMGDPAKAMGAAGFHHTITESAAADPGGNMTMTDFIRESWTAAWGGAGLTGVTLEAEEEFVLVPEIKWNDYKLQGCTRLVKLASVSYMVKGRLVGPTHTQIDTAIGINAGRTLGSSFAESGHDLILTSTSGKVITLKNADAVGTGFEFGGTKLGTGETGFVNAMTLTTGAADPLITFSA
jgi:hypothetical protein